MLILLKKGNKKFALSEFLQYYSIMLKKLDEICSILPGVSLRKKPTESGDKLAPRLLSISSLNRDYIDLSDDHHTKIEPISNIDKYKLQAGDIAFSTRGTINKASMMTESQKTYITPAQIFIIRPDKSRINPLYLTHYLNSNNAKRLFQSKQRGTVIKNLTKTSLAELLVYLPSLEDQQRIVGFNQLITKEKELQDRIHTLRVNLFEQTIKPSVINTTISS